MERSSPQGKQVSARQQGCWVLGESRRAHSTPATTLLGSEGRWSLSTHWVPHLF